MTDNEKTAEEQEKVTPETAEEKETSRKEKKKEKKEAEEKQKEIDRLKKELDRLTESEAEAKDNYTRLYAEFDNFKKRSAKEKDETYSAAYADALGQLLPVFDNIERAVQFAADEQSKAGLSMIVSQFGDVLAAMGIEAYGAPEEDFDARYHNAVMHIEDENYGENKIVEVFQRGYRKGDKVIRYAMVKVAN